LLVEGENELKTRTKQKENKRKTDSKQLLARRTNTGNFYSVWRYWAT